MFIAQKLRRQSTSAYLIYMYQVEDLVRAYRLDAERIAAEYLPRFDYDVDQLGKAAEWYAALCRMMQEEGKQEGGHLQVVQNTLSLLEERHRELLADTENHHYNAVYYKALPYIVELRSQGNNSEKSEMENCIDALYGATLLGMQGKELSAGTKAALGPISRLVLLAEAPEDSSAATSAEKH